MLKKFVYSLENARNHLKIAIRMMKIGLSTSQDNRVLAKVLLEIQKSVSSIIDFFILYEIKTKKIKFSGDKEQKAKIFFTKIGKKYLERRDLEVMMEVLRLSKKHKNAHLEFARKEKLVIFSTFGYEILNLDKIMALISRVGSILTSITSKHKI